MVRGDRNSEYIVYFNIHEKREREREGERKKERDVFIYLYIYIHAKCHPVITCKYRWDSVELMDIKITFRNCSSAIGRIPDDPIWTLKFESCLLEMVSMA